MMCGFADDAQLLWETVLHRGWLMPMMRGLLEFWYTPQTPADADDTPLLLDEAYTSAGLCAPGSQNRASSASGGLGVNPQRARILGPPCKPGAAKAAQQQHQKSAGLWTRKDGASSASAGLHGNLVPLKTTHHQHQLASVRRKEHASSASAGPGVILVPRGPRIISISPVSV